MELSLVSNPFGRVFSSVLSLQHLHRVKELIGVPEIGSIVCFIVDAINLDIVSETWQKYINELATSDDAKNLIIVKVKKLPKNASIEWGGCSFKNSIGMYEDEQETKPQALEITKMVDLFEISNVVNINHGSIQLITLFTNDFDLVRNLIEFNDSLCHRLQIFTRLADASNLGGNFEIVPVLQSWTYQKRPFAFTIVWTVENY
jgi:diphthine-ammonia ligase